MGGFECNHSFCSPTDIEAIVVLIAARALRIISTVSNVFIVDLSIAEYLPRRANLNSWIPQPHVHGMVTMNPRQVDDVPKVPAHEHIHASDRGHRDMLGIRQHPRPQHALCKVAPREFGSRWRQLQKLDVIGWHHSKHFADRGRRRFKLSQRQGRKHEMQVATHERIQKSARGNPELVIFAAADNRRVCINPIWHVSILRLAWT